MKITILIIAIIVTSCCCNNAKKATNKDLNLIPSPKVLIYKTKSDYSQNVPIIMSEDKKEIISYPHPSDLKVGNNYSTPSKLTNEYLLDNRGISENVVFIRLTYEEYSKLNEPPTLKEFMDMIIDFDPLTELYECGFRSNYKDIISEFNTIIGKNKISEFKKLK